MYTELNSATQQLGPDADLITALSGIAPSGGSDLHVTANACPSMRLHGDLEPLSEFGIWGKEKVEHAVLSLMNPTQHETFAREQELDFAFALDATTRFRVNVYLQRGSMGAAFRIIPNRIKNLEELGLDAKLASFASLPRGLVLVTGPTGSGKSSTLAAIINVVNETRAGHIVTVEDPIEFVHKHKKSLITQREVGNDTHSFSAALKHVLRQDPDVILVGELRDLETVSVALTAAETGHLVFASLHTQSAAQTIDRVIDVYPPHQQNQVRTQLSATLQGVICQTLIPKLDGSGRVVATEVMIRTPAISNMIREGQSHQIPASLQAGTKFGMHTLDQDLADLANRGIISRELALESAQEPENLTLMLKSAGYTSSSAPHMDNPFADTLSYGV